MSLVINRQYSCVNYDPVEISVEFVVLHYTCVSLEGALEIFQNPDQRASAHLLIDEKGTVYECVPCLDGPCLRAWHAGPSRWKHWQEFNNFSIGIELVNRNGNLFPYTKWQYRALTLVVRKLLQKYPALTDPNRVLGHEHIAGFRGKIDPGYCFNWSLFFKQTWSDGVSVASLRKPILLEKSRNQFLKIASDILRAGEGSDQQWSLLNRQMENSLTT